LKVQDSIGTPTPKVGVHLEMWRFILSHSPTFRNMKCDSRASLLAHTFASPCLGREPKVRVTTLSTINDAPLGLLSVIQSKNLLIINFVNKCKPKAHYLTPTNKYCIGVPYANKINSK
jgi:hypothetical protein